MEEIRVRRVVQTEDLSNVEFETSEDVEVIPTFDSMGLREELLRGIYAYGGQALWNGEGRGELSSSDSSGNTVPD
uniref:(California timema) hypothetical protein n=1 Tax=Timema californicum TaxID=61474 RepID=A0A7R9J122_TIMCA|nr:unnamed protein product [Timema californicum]